MHFGRHTLASSFLLFVCGCSSAFATKRDRERERELSELKHPAVTRKCAMRASLSGDHLPSLPWSRDVAREGGREENVVREKCPPSLRMQSKGDIS